jgi:hypothetical protein
MRRYALGIPPADGRNDLGLAEMLGTTGRPANIKATLIWFADAMESI